MRGIVAAGIPLSALAALAGFSAGVYCGAWKQANADTAEIIRLQAVIQGLAPATISQETIRR